MRLMPMQGLVRFVTTGLLLALWGLGLEARRRTRALHMIWPALTVLLLLFLSARTDKIRFLMPATFVFALFAGRAVVRGLESARSTMRVTTLAVAGWALVLGGIHAVDLTREMMWNSHRSAAAWLDAHSEPGQRLAYFGPVQKLPALPAGMRTERGLPYLGAMVHPWTDAAATADVLARWKEDPPDYVLLLPDYLGPGLTRFGGTCPPGIFEALQHDAGWIELPVFQTPRWRWPLARPELDYPVVNPPITLFVRTDR